MTCMHVLPSTCSECRYWWLFLRIQKTLYYLYKHPQLIFISLTYSPAPLQKEHAFVFENLECFFFYFDKLWVMKFLKIFFSSHFIETWEMKSHLNSQIFPCFRLWGSGGRWSEYDKVQIIIIGRYFLRCFSKNKGNCWDLFLVLWDPWLL